MSRRQAHLVFFRVIPALVAAAALVAASMAGWAFIAGSALFAGSTLTGCPSGDSGATYTPITGIVIDPDTLTAGYGCGTGRGQVYKYAALLTYVDDAGVASTPSYASVFGCFSQGIFANLPGDDSGSLSFEVSIYAFDQASYPSALDNVAYQGDVSYVLANVAAANWTTTCSATQQSGVSVVALCAPLAPVGGSTTDAGTSDTGAPGDAGDAGDVGAADASEAGSNDTGDASSNDAGDAGSNDAGDAGSNDAGEAGEAGETG